MARVEVDLENVESPIEPALYKVEITNADMKQTKSDGSTYIAWELTIVEEGDFFGRKVFYNSNLNDKKLNKQGEADVNMQKKAAFYLREFLRMFGVEYDPSGFDTDTALHSMGIAKVTIEEFEGRPVNRVEKVMAIPTE